MPPRMRRSRPTAYVNESTLTRTRYVAPKFPHEARLRSIEGWVELHFVVGTDGTVGELAVVGAQPVGVFEQAALDAVRHWHYQPLLRTAHPSASARACGCALRCSDDARRKASAGARDGGGR